MRSRILRDLGLISTIPPYELTWQTLAEAVLERLYELTTINPSLYLDLAGALHVAQFLLEYVTH
jgi:predicted glycosyltransferase